MRTDITELPHLYVDCEIALTRFSLAIDRKVRVGKQRGLFLNEAALEARSEIKSVLATWSGMVADERGLAKPASRAVTDLAAFLTIHLDWLLAHDVGPYFVDEIGAIATTARRACRPGTALHLDLGQCAREDCRSALFVTSSAVDSSPSVQVRCEAGHVWPPHEWLLLAHRARQEGGGRSSEPAVRTGA